MAGPLSLLCSTRILVRCVLHICTQVACDLRTCATCVHVPLSRSHVAYMYAVCRAVQVGRCGAAAKLNSEWESDHGMLNSGLEAKLDSGVETGNQGRAAGPIGYGCGTLTAAIVEGHKGRLRGGPQRPPSWRARALFERASVEGPVRRGRPALCAARKALCSVRGGSCQGPRKRSCCFRPPAAGRSRTVREGPESLQTPILVSRVSRSRLEDMLPLPRQ